VRNAPVPGSAGPGSGRAHRWRGGLGYFVMGLIVLCGAVWSFGALVEIGNVATTKQSLTTLPVPFAGYLFAGSVDLFIFYGYLKCYGPAWQIALSVFHILIGLATSLWFQWQHSKGIVDPVAVSVVPALAVAVSLDTWVVSQLVDWFHTRNRPDWPIPVPQNPAPEDVPSTATPPGPVQPEPVPPARPRPTQDVARTRGRPVGRGRPPENGTLSKADMTALDRARKDPAVVEQTVARRGLDRSAVAARPERWPLPSRNGDRS
jgi:hypothetical protein